MKEIIEKLKNSIATGWEPKLSPSEVKQILKALKWKGCDTCKSSKLSEPMKGTELELSCDNKKSRMYHMYVNETIKCIHHKRNERNN